MCNSLFAENAANAKVTASGKTGNCSWTLTVDSVLTISGNGAMASYETELPSTFAPENRFNLINKLKKKSK
jgi:hypothetical protein